MPNTAPISMARPSEAGSPQAARSRKASRRPSKALGSASARRVHARQAFGRSPGNPVGGWYGLRNGYRGRFGMYLPPLLEVLGLAELTHDTRSNQMRAI